MELNINKVSSMIPLLLSIVIKNNIDDTRLDFVYGQEEYTKDLKKVKKQFKRQLKKTFNYGSR
jgi:hypothetical protein|tara:strand:+ start:6585 stop:6773 length:189 start_codon:yes stop_codon:yes gene_type:complete